MPVLVWVTVLVRYWLGCFEDVMLLLDGINNKYMYDRYR